MRAELPSYAVLVDGHAMPKPVGGHPALDFCNTRAGWERVDPRGEWLQSYDQLVTWTGFAELLDRAATERLRSTPRAAGDAVLARMRSFRIALHDTLVAPTDEAAFGAVAEVADRANALTCLTLGADGLARRVLVESSDPELPLHAIALTAADLLCSAERSIVRVCPGDECGWLFLDRRGRRRWCNMATCGNRAKVRAHADRTRGH